MAREYRFRVESLYQDGGEDVFLAAEKALVPPRRPPPSGSTEGPWKVHSFVRGRDKGTVIVLWERDF